MEPLKVYSKIEIITQSYRTPSSVFAQEVEDFLAELAIRIPKNNLPTPPDPKVTFLTRGENLQAVIQYFTFEIPMTKSKELVYEDTN